MNPVPTRAPTGHAWRLAGRTLPLGERAVVVGILNVTPDSFSDGGDWLSPEAAIRHGRQLAQEGADLIDVGGESTRPGALEVPTQEQLRRVLPVVGALAEAGLAVSIDTRKAAVAEAAVRAGAVVINDVSGGGFDCDMLPLAARLGVGLVLMHMRGTPATMQSQTDYTDVVDDVRSELLVRAEAARAAGVASECIALDPGIGFAKTAQQNYSLLARLAELTTLPYPLLLGTSRKSFLGLPPDAPASQRDLATSATLVAARLAGAAILRVHNVALARAFLDVADRIREAARP